MLTATMIAGVLLRDYYRRDSVVVTKLQMIQREQEEKESLESTQKAIKANEARKAELRAKEKKELHTIATRRTAVQDRERREKGQAQARFDVTVNALNVRRHAINRAESEALRKIQDRTGAEVARLNRQISSLATAESDELSNTLRRLQEQAMAAHLMSRSIDRATIPGVGEKLKARLWAVGIRTAADVEYWRATRAEGIGHTKARALVEWRDRIASFAKMPTALSQANVTAIKSKYAVQKQQCEAQRDAAQLRLNSEVSAVRAQTASEMKALNDQQAAAQDKLNQELRAIDAQYGHQYAALTQTQANVSSDAEKQCQKVDEEIGRLRKKMGEHHWQLTKVRRDLLSYSNVSFKSYLRRVLKLRIS
jgi:hypothetical protein